MSHSPEVLDVLVPEYHLHMLASIVQWHAHASRGCTAACRPTRVMTATAQVQNDVVLGSHPEAHQCVRQAHYSSDKAAKDCSVEHEECYRQPCHDGGQDEAAAVFLNPVCVSCLVSPPAARRHYNHDSSSFTPCKFTQDLLAAPRYVGDALTPHKWYGLLGDLGDAQQGGKHEERSDTPRASKRVLSDLHQYRSCSRGCCRHRESVATGTPPPCSPTTTRFWADR